jgi:hypothetical protein
MRGTREGEPADGKPRSVLVTGAFWAATGERAVKTFAQGAVLVIGVAGVTPADVDWKGALMGGAFGAVLSVLTSVSSAGVGNPGPSLASEELAPQDPPADTALGKKV